MRPLALLPLLALLVACGGTAAPTRSSDPVDAPTAASTAAPSVVSSSAPIATPSTTPSATQNPSPSAAPSVPTSTPTTSQAIAIVRALQVKGRAPKTGYVRSAFGQTWADVDRNGCDTRNDILRRDLTDLVVKSGTFGCVALSGLLPDPYSGTTISFTRGDMQVQIDHVVALSDAWQKGAQQWDLVKRTAFANDPLNLLAVSSSLNTQKSDSDAASWLPPNKSYRCAFVARQAAVKRKYALWLTQAEQDAMLRVLTACPGVQVLTADPVPAILG